MRSFGTRIRGGIAAALSAALIVSGVAFGATTAQAAELPSDSVNAAASAQPAQTAEPAQPAETADPAPAQSAADAPAAEAPSAPGVDAQETEASPASPAAPADEPAPQLLAQPEQLAQPAAEQAAGQVWAPAITLALADGTPLAAGDKVYQDDVIVVQGSGFDPLSHPRPVTPARPPITAGDPTGNYIVFGNFGSAWQPSAGAPGSTRSVGNQRWALTDATYGNIAANYLSAVTGQRTVLHTDGTFTAELTAKAAAASPGSYGVFTYVAGGGANDAAQELEIRLEYVDSARPAAPVFTPELKVFLADGTTPYSGQQLVAGDKLVVTGSGFDPAANVPGGAGGVPIPNSLPQGTFVVFGSFADSWKPSAGAPGSSRVMDASNRGWALDPAVLAQVPNQYRAAISNGGYTPLDADGNFSWTVTLKEPANPLQGGRWGIYSYTGGASGITNAAQEIAVPLNFTSASDTPDEQQGANGGLLWAFKDTWAGYVTSIANGSIVVSGGATRGAGDVIGFEQVSNNFNTTTGRGNIVYRGTVNYVSTDHGFNIALKNPWITVTAGGTTLTAEVSTSDTAGTSSMARVIVADLQTTQPTRGDNGVLTWSNVAGVFADSVQPSTWYEQYRGQSIAPITFSLGENTTGEVDPEAPNVPVVPPVVPPVAPPAPAQPVGGGQQAGSLSWGISSGFAAYTTGSIAKGSIATSGVGVGSGGYTFPQAAGGGWNSASQTGTVQYSGVVSFSGHGGLMVETFANPVITVNDAVSGTITAGGRTFILNLAAAGRSIGAGGEITFSGVPVIGSVSGGGGSGSGAGSGSFAADPLTFTVGAASSVNYGSTTVTNPSLNRQAASTPPATAGVTIVTPEEQLVEGGEIEITASGFQPNESGILVVIYSEPTVLDVNAKADANGVVRWIGELPEGLSGEHTITLQGSINAGKVIKIQTHEEFEAAQAKADKTDRDTMAARGADAAETVAGLGPVDDAAYVWVWWVGALALLVLAGGMTGLVVAQRRRSNG